MWWTSRDLIPSPTGVLDNLPLTTQALSFTVMDGGDVEY